MFIASWNIYYAVSLVFNISFRFLEGFVLETVKKNVLVFMNVITNDVHTEFCFKKSMFIDFI